MGVGSWELEVDNRGRSSDILSGMFREHLVDQRLVADYQQISTDEKRPANPSLVASAFLGEGPLPVKPAKPAVVCVRGDPLAAVFDREYREPGVLHEVARHVRCLA